MAPRTVARRVMAPVCQAARREHEGALRGGQLLGRGRGGGNERVTAGRGGEPVSEEDVLARPVLAGTGGGDGPSRSSRSPVIPAGEA
jgi:hypothetical protein